MTISFSAPTRPRHGSNTRVLLLALAAAALLADRGRCLAQETDRELSHPAIERYNKTAKGANVEEWKRRLSEPDVRTRLDAVDSLGTKGGDEAVKPLIEATADADYRVRIRAIDFLGSLKATEASPVLMQLLFLTDVGREEKLRSLTALSQIADPATSERLLSYARSINDDELACRAVYAVGAIGDPATKEKLASLKGTRPGSDMDRLVTDALIKIDAKEKTKPSEQPTLIELEQRLAKQQEAAQKAAQKH